ncbi:MAG: NAD-binding protein [Candidatus Omnitrophica bacterium]|nr:NAD-binding protein [Candidatus Omnitrophota bacterium]MBU1924458.1 NAD-binding protein [Candidatus Omnitrophota bacterium]MBU2063222.1 NAD-binding protein [Candidatus Omnitrophota bacterium]
MHILIVGGGKVGYHLAKRLRTHKHVLSLIEKNEAICHEIARDLDILVIHGDGCDQKTLEEADIRHCDVVVALTGDDEDNLIICQLAKRVYRVLRTVARVNDSDNEHCFSELGVDVPVDSTEIIARIIEEEVSFSDLVNLMTFKRGKLSIVRVDLDRNSPVVNKSVKDIRLPPNSVLVSIIRGEAVIVPQGDTILQERDDIIALTLIENEQQLLESLVGKIKG